MDIQKMVSTHQIQPKQCSGTEKSDPKGIFGANTFNATWTPIEVRQDQQSFRFSMKMCRFLKANTQTTYHQCRKVVEMDKCSLISILGHF